MKKLIIAGILTMIGLIMVVIYLNYQSPQPIVSSPTALGSRSLNGNIEKIKLISNGESVDLQKHLVKDYVIVFDFYADWCGPCKVLGPKIEELVNQYDNVLLRKINIVNWNSNVTRQYAIQFVPNVRVYDRKGQMVGEPTPEYGKIANYLSQARKSQ
ncbi:MAG: thioredoxin family protein [bacterium]|nr:thioredoxin family protein [bacterium]MDD5756408.1 thioredoxin family protein [bacterium]